ncbi:MAG: hypothetical protein RSG52_15575 [Terrisporobacter sp.]|uniref:hypothetical protein n=1 Tax=Terrisporobacter sp. TaxID=1965305 RepID=UPI002FCA9C29
MNKILTLYDIEFKRVKKAYFSILGLLILSNIVLIINMLHNVAEEIGKILNVKGTISLLRHSEAYNIIESGTRVFDTYSITYLIMNLAIIWCLYYAFYIWYRDFYGKTKSIYTLFMLPYNRFNIYLSKLITTISLIYGVIITQYLLWIIQMFIIKGFTQISASSFIDIINYNSLNTSLLLDVSIYPVEFIIAYLLTPIILVILIFTAIMIHKSLNRFGGILGIAYVIITGLIFGYTYSYDFMYSDEKLIFLLGFYSIVTLVSITISYILINKKMHI